VRDPEIKKKFCDMDAHVAKKTGRFVILRSDWEEIKDEVMYQCVKDKFTRNPLLKQKLLDTKYEDLVEGNDHGDDYWGVFEGTGQNKLGKILMRVRGELRKCR
jgi:ribA/ribD-fused uncharacterized protein